MLLEHRAVGEIEAVQLVLAANRELAQAALDGASDVIREPLRLDPVA